MKISKKLNDAINTQIGEELKASNGYANMAAYFNSEIGEIVSRNFDMLYWMIRRILKIYM